MTTRSEGITADGVRVVVVLGGRQADDEVWIDGERVEVHRTELHRDGGTRIYETDRGTLTLPRRINSKDRTPRWVPSTGGGARHG